MSDPVGLDATLARNSIARDIADVMFGTVDDGVILDVLQWQGCLLAANRIMESSRLPGTVTTEYHDRLILQAQAEINIRGNRIAELEAENRLLRAAVDEVWRQAARAVLNGAEVVPDENGQPVFAIPGPGPIANLSAPAGLPPKG